VPVGVAGEIYSGGAGLAAAYFRAQELTADRFVTREIAGRSTRVYRTGDLGYWRPDGTAVYLGRVDRQVKVHGYRIELDEVEARLGTHSMVERCAVHLAGETLEAYVVPREGPRPDADALRAHVGQWLPPPMIPSRYFFVDELPITANAKTDRRAPLSRAVAAESAPARAPQSAVERLVAGLFASVLDLAEVSCDSNFFQYGGDSVGAIRIVGRVNEAFGTNVGLLPFLQQPTVASLARVIDADLGDASLVDRIARVLLGEGDGLAS
jgi:acyl carrier protein